MMKKACRSFQKLEKGRATKLLKTQGPGIQKTKNLRRSVNSQTTQTHHEDCQLKRESENMFARGLALFT
jgi:hypothetical protein